MPTGLVALLAGACAEPRPTAREEGQENWNAARARIKVRIADDHFAAGNIEAAERAIAEAQRLAPEDTEMYALRARIWLAAGRSVDALELLSNVSEEAPSAAECAYLRGIIHQQQQRWDAARGAYAQAVSAAPEQWPYLAALVQTLLQLGETEVALAELTAARERFGWDAAWHGAVAECHERRGDWNEAILAWQRAAVSPAADREHQARLAEALCAAGRQVEAIPVLEGLLHGEPGEAPLRLRLAEACFAVGLYREARRQLEPVLAENRQHVAALRLLACCLAAEQDDAAALATVRQALAVAPGDALALELAAAVAWRLGGADASREYVQRLAVVRPDSEVAARLRAARGTANR